MVNFRFQLDWTLGFRVRGKNWKFEKAGRTCPQWVLLPAYLADESSLRNLYNCFFWNGESQMRGESLFPFRSSTSYISSIWGAHSPPQGGWPRPPLSCRVYTLYMLQSLYIVLLNVTCIIRVYIRVKPYGRMQVLALPLVEFGVLLSYDPWTPGG